MADFTNTHEPAPGPAAELWKRTLVQIPTHFGRLVYMAGLREASAGQYVYGPLTDVVGFEIAGRTLAVSHHSVFAEWIALPLSKQKSDLAEFLAGSTPPSGATAYRDLWPASAHEVERQLYLTDLETLLDLLRFEQDAAASARAALPHP